MTARGTGRLMPTVAHSQSPSTHQQVSVDLAALIGPDDDRPASWRDDALCAQVDTGDIFYPPKGASSRDAKRLCGLCEVRQQCLEFALDTGERYGIWGGLSERERRRMRIGPPGRQRGRPEDTAKPIKHGTLGGYMAHRRRGEAQCTDCRAASAEYSRLQRAKRGVA